MASKRVSSTAIDWASFAKKIPAAQKASFTALKQKHDGYMRSVNSLPEAAPKIDFAGYKSKIPIAGMVDDFQKKYEALQVPYPKDTISAGLDQQLVSKKAEYTKFCADSATKIASIQVEMEKWSKMRPLEDMNMEEILVQAPELELVNDPRTPTMHPHDQTSEQMDETLKELYKKHGGGDH